MNLKGVEIIKMNDKRGSRLVKRKSWQNLLNCRCPEKIGFFTSFSHLLGPCVPSVAFTQVISVLLLLSRRLASILSSF